jgi:hypothetical protein
VSLPGARTVTLSHGALNAERALASAAQAVTAAAPFIDLAVARAAVERVTSRTRSCSMIATHLAEHPTALVRW